MDAAHRPTHTQTHPPRIHCGPTDPPTDPPRPTCLPPARPRPLVYRRYAALWQLAASVVAEADPLFSSVYTACAFTHNFVGSPHIDTQDVGPFYAVALGGYRGGELCVESGAREVSMIDTRGRLAKVDGRCPHWVAPFEGERFSVIYYQVESLVARRSPFQHTLIGGALLRDLPPSDGGRERADGAGCVRHRRSRWRWRWRWHWCGGADSDSRVGAPNSGLTSSPLSCPPQMHQATHGPLSS
jgi:hypothetical protein